MGFEGGPNGASTRRITREVRWFADGELAISVLNWFTKGVSYEVEQRVDCYDLEAARRGLGNKVRNRSVLDLKHRLNRDRVAHLAPRVVGRVQDWVKVTRPLGPSEPIPASWDIDIAKEIYTRRYHCGPGQYAGAGCEVELTAITSGRTQAWSLCFETFGDPGRRVDLLQQGVDRFFANTPLPTGFDLELKNSCCYPTWIRARTLQSI
jgi:hypothetical protein